MKPQVNQFADLSPHRISIHLISIQPPRNIGNGAEVIHLIMHMIWHLFLLIFLFVSFQTVSLKEKNISIFTYNCYKFGSLVGTKLY